ncbi:MAG: hypothetical protein NTU61_04620 [Candidatus Altiarchaeota archaeon]|nr:hypothetical protein [Candidatus Altiarchaeota archaeon]
MGFVLDGVKDTLGFCLRSRGFLLLVLVLAVFSFVNVLFSGLDLAGVLFSLFFVLVSFVLGGVVLCFLKVGSLDGAFRVVPKYLVNLFLLGVASLVIAGLLVVFAVAVVGVSFLVMQFNWVLGAGLVAVAVGLSIVVLVHVSLRLYFSSLLVVFEDLGVLDSLRRSWEISSGRVFSIFYANMALSIVFLVPLLPLYLLQFVFSQVNEPVLAYAVLAVVSVLQGFYGLSSDVLSFMLYRGLKK